MATEQSTRDGEGLPAVHHCPLSGFEQRCLLKRIFECHEIVQIAILGAGSANEKAGGLGAICEALRLAEQEIARAERLAAADLDQQVQKALSTLGARAASRSKS